MAMVEAMADGQVPVVRHFYRCSGCAITQHIPGDPQGERELDCTICGECAAAVYVRSETVRIDPSMVTGEDVVVDEEEDGLIDDEKRWALERSRFLSSSEIGLPERVAEAVAWKELGYSSSGIAKRMTTSLGSMTESTVKRYLSSASETYPGILLRTVRDIDGAVDAGVDDLNPPPSRECPVCLKERLCSIWGARRVFGSLSDWGATSMLEDADVVCSYCHSVRIDGQWQRMETVGSRAYHLSQESSSKSTSDYREILTRGIDITKERPTVDDAEDW